MLIPSIIRKRSIQCPISGAKFWHNGNPKKRALCLCEQQEFTADLIIELDGPNASGIRRPILYYHKEFNRRPLSAAQISIVDQQQPSMVGCGG